MTASSTALTRAQNFNHPDDCRGVHGICLPGNAPVLAFLYWAAKCSNVPFKMLMKGIKPLRIILILTFVLNLFFSNGTTPPIDWWIFHITREGLTGGGDYSLRLVFLVLATSLMTLTTSPRALRRH